MQYLAVRADTQNVDCLRFQSEKEHYALKSRQSEFCWFDVKHKYASISFVAYDNRPFNVWWGLWTF